MLYFAVLLLVTQCLFASPDVRSITTLLRAREFSQALTQIAPQLRQFPQNPQLLTLQGIAHNGLGDRNTALTDYRRALKIAPDYIPALKAEAQIEYQEGDKNGIGTLRRILRQEPNDPVSHAMLAALAFQEHDCKTTIENYEATEELLASQPVALTQYGQCLEQENQQAKAMIALRQAVAIAPENWQLRYNLSLEEFRAQQTTEARKDLQPLLTTDQHRPEVLNLAATLDESAGDTPHAVGFLRRAIIDDPRNAALYLHFADLCFVHRSFQVGIDMLNVGLTQLGNSAQLYVARGVMFVQLGKYENAVADFKKAEALDPNQSFSSVAQGLTKLQENKLDAALTSTKDELKRDPRNAFLHYLLAETLRQKGVTPPSMEFNEAVEETRAAIRLKPDYPIAEDLLGSFYLKEEKVQLAQQQFESALRHDPSNESAIYHMITVARKTGHTSQVPGLVKRLAAAKAADKKRDDLAGQFMLVEAK
jgi:tetratricopeptide (TPR) repeat protein